MNISSILGQSTALIKPQLYCGQGGESADAASLKFDRWMISLSEIDSFLQGKDRAAVESIAERMCKGAEHQQGRKSCNLSNPEKDSGACGLPVDDSQKQKVKNITGLVLRLQSGVQQLLDEVNGRVAEEPFTGTKQASQIEVQKGEFDQQKIKALLIKARISDSQQTATNSEVKNKKDPLKKELSDYLEDYGRQSVNLEEQFLQWPHSDHSLQQCIAKMKDLRGFYLKSLKAANVLIIKFVGMPAYINEHLILNKYIAHMRTLFELMDKQIYQLEQEELRKKRSGCKQS
ncbi:hypothetical protein [Endozoicomonas sp. ONNA2]|uniref:hypothetical protein n=1 Tax=Endozoicomonas sp. ONNA2 TaxID=2828741 RepID=UPI002148BADF|nr:hypothetical protein [Endozoicomonas sp. ONNA2]